jgi:hypothetical protein
LVGGSAQLIAGEQVVNGCNDEGVRIKKHTLRSVTTKSTTVLAI